MRGLEIFKFILGYIPLKDASSLSMTCRYLCEIIRKKYPAFGMYTFDIQQSTDLYTRCKSHSFRMNERKLTCARNITMNRNYFQYSFEEAIFPKDIDYLKMRVYKSSELSPTYFSVNASIHHSYSVGRELNYMIIRNKERGEVFIMYYTSNGNFKMTSIGCALDDKYYFQIHNTNSRTGVNFREKVSKDRKGKRFFQINHSNDFTTLFGKA
jgi:hypothetical protein